MKRSASEIINELEMRIARLERGVVTDPKIAGLRSNSGAVLKKRVEIDYNKFKNITHFLSETTHLSNAKYYMGIERWRTALDTLLEFQAELEAILARDQQMDIKREVLDFLESISTFIEKLTPLVEKHDANRSAYLSIANELKALPYLKDVIPDYRKIKSGYV